MFSSSPRSTNDTKPLFTTSLSINVFFANDSQHTKGLLVSDNCHKTSFRLLVRNINHLTKTVKTEWIKNHLVF